jgi:hypothetical protein
LIIVGELTQALFIRIKTNHHEDHSRSRFASLWIERLGASAIVTGSLYG